MQAFTLGSSLLAPQARHFRRLAVWLREDPLPKLDYADASTVSLNYTHQSGHIDYGAAAAFSGGES